MVIFNVLNRRITILFSTWTFLLFSFLVLGLRILWVLLFPWGLTSIATVLSIYWHEIFSYQFIDHERNFLNLINWNYLLTFFNLYRFFLLWSLFLFWNWLFIFLAVQFHMILMRSRICLSFSRFPTNNTRRGGLGAHNLWETSYCQQSYYQKDKDKVLSHFYKIEIISLNSQINHFYCI